MTSLDNPKCISLSDHDKNVESLTNARSMSKLKNQIAKTPTGKVLVFKNVENREKLLYDRK